jgi:hypothetical protein
MTVSRTTMATQASGGVAAGGRTDAAIDVSSELTRTILGVDRYFRTERGGGDGGKLDAEGLVPVHWSPLEPVEVHGWEDAKGRLRRVAERASVLPSPYERDWLTEQALAMLTLTRWLSAEALAYEEVVAGALRVDPRPPDARTVRHAIERRARAVADAGYESFAAYQEEERVAPDDVSRVTQELIAAARARTEARLPTLRLPSDIIGVEAVSGTPFSAYCDYPGRKVWINTDIPLTRAALKHLVAHEAYPGHDAHMGHRDALVRAGEMLPDGALVVTNTASSALFEGIAECGLDLLEWRTERGDRVAWAHDRLEWLASIEVAHGLNTGRMDAAAAERLLRDWCDADDAWIDAKLRFVTHAVRAPFVYGYWWGGTAVGRWWRRVGAWERDAAVRHLYDRMHSPSTLAAHAAGTASSVPFAGAAAKAEEVPNHVG